LPLKDEHLAQAAHNEKLAETLFKTQYYDWTITTYFYASLHYMDSILAVSGAHPKDHDERDSLVGTHLNLKRLFKEYKSLKVRSRAARYYATPMEPSDAEYAKRDYETIKSYCRKIMKLD
jgi:HEPN domain-containing protein